MTLPTTGVGAELTVELRHSFDAAHRLPHLAGAGKCASLHGHTWHTELGLAGPVTGEGVVVEFGSVKQAWRRFIDDHLDHGALLGVRDPLLDALRQDGGKLYVFGRDAHTDGLPWPTVEAVATVLVRAAHDVLTLPEGCRVSSVTVTETPVNSVTWRPS